MNSNRQTTTVWIGLITCLLFNTVQAYAQNKIKRTITKEIAVQPGASLDIEGSYSSIQIKSGDQDKVRIVYEFYHDSAMQASSDDQWLEAAGLTIRSFNNRIDIKGGFKRENFEWVGPKINAAYDTKGPKAPKGPKEPKAPKGAKDRQEAIEAIKSQPAKAGVKESIKQERDAMRKEMDIKRSHLFEKRAEATKSSIFEKKINRATPRVITIFVPKDIVVEIDNEYGDVRIALDLAEADLEIQHGILETQDITNLDLKGKYCNAHLGNITKADIEFENGTLRAQEILDLDLDSKSSTIDYDKGRSIYLRSNADEINIDEIGQVGGRKAYGNLRIGQLMGNVDIEGSNADIKFRKIDPQVEKIRINNKYADLRLPVRNMANYFVDFNGHYSTVFASFEKQVPKEEPVDPKAKDNMTVLEVQHEKTKQASDWAKGFGDKKNLGEVAPHRFTSTVGDVKGKHTRIELICNACTVDFK